MFSDVPILRPLKVDPSNESPGKLKLRVYPTPLRGGERKDFKKGNPKELQ
jgi:hypothetical protein